MAPEEVGLGTVDLLLASGLTAVIIGAVVMGPDTLWRRVRHPVLRIPAFAGVGILAGLLLGWVALRRAR